MRTVMGITLALALAAPAFAAKGDDTLRFFLSKSDLVVLGEITSEAVGVMEERGVVNYLCDFRIAEVLKGKKPKTETIHIHIVRFELDQEDRLPELKKGGQCILFLKKTSGERPAWRTADVWFGVQRPSPVMAQALKRLAEPEAAGAAERPDDVLPPSPRKLTVDSLKRLLGKDGVGPDELYGHELEFVGTVLSIKKAANGGKVPVVSIEGLYAGVSGWMDTAYLHHLPPDAVEVGDRLKVRSLIVGHGYGPLFLWFYSAEGLEAEPAPQPAPAKQPVPIPDRLDIVNRLRDALKSGTPAEKEAALDMIRELKPIKLIPEVIVAIEDPTPLPRHGDTGWGFVGHQAATVMGEIARAIDGVEVKDRGYDAFSFHNDQYLGREDLKASGRLAEVRKNWAKWWDAARK